MKRYLVFAHEEYYPYGGWKDFEGDFDSIEEANRLRASLHENRDEGNENSMVSPVSQIVDTQRKRIVINKHDEKPIEYFDDNLKAMFESKNNEKTL